MLFASQVFVRIEIKHFLPIEVLRLPAVPINLVVWPEMRHGCQYRVMHILVQFPSELFDFTESSLFV